MNDSKMRTYGLGFLALLLGCGGDHFANKGKHTEAQTARALQTCVDQNRVKGQPSLFTLTPGEDAGPTFETPRVCPGANGENGVFIRVTRLGRRRLAYDRTESKECDRPDADALQCPTVSVHVFGHAVLAALRARLGENNADSMGLGLCAKATDPFEKWDLSCEIHDWRYANEAVRVIWEELGRWDLEGSWGLGVTGMMCGVAL